MNSVYEKAILCKLTLYLARFKPFQVKLGVGYTVHFSGKQGAQKSYFHFFFNHTLYSDHKTEEIFQKYQIKKNPRLFYQMACNRVNFGIQETLKTDLFQLELFPED